MLSGNAALVTGSTSGIACTLAADTSDILLYGFGAHALIDKLLAEFRYHYKVRASYSPADRSKPADVAPMVAQTPAVPGDALVYFRGPPRGSRVESLRCLPVSGTRVATDCAVV